MPKATTSDTSIESKLDEIVEHLRRLDRRDRMRTIGGAIRSVISLCWIVLLLWSSWYFIVNWPTIMKEITTQAASSAADFTKQNTKSVYDQILNNYKTPGQ